MDRLSEELTERLLERELLLKPDTGVSAAAVAEAWTLRDASWLNPRARLMAGRPRTSQQVRRIRPAGLIHIRVVSVPTTKVA